MRRVREVLHAGIETPAGPKIDELLRDDRERLTADRGHAAIVDAFAALPMTSSACLVELRAVRGIGGKRITSVAALAYFVGLWTLHTSYHMFNGTVNFLFTFTFLMLLDAVLLGVTRSRRA